MRRNEYKIKAQYQIKMIHFASFIEKSKQETN